MLFESRINCANTAELFVIMSGEITVTSSKTWSGTDPVTQSKLNLTASPTARLDEDSVTSREIDSDDFLANFADAFRGTNFMFNPVFWDQYWEDTSGSGKSCPDGELTENAEGWHRS